MHFSGNRFERGPFLGATAVNMNMQKTFDIMGENSDFWNVLQFSTQNFDPWFSFNSSCVSVNADSHFKYAMTVIRMNAGGVFFFLFFIR